MKEEHNESRREFIQQTAVLGAGIILAGPAAQRLFAQGNAAKSHKHGRIKKAMLPGIHRDN
jgi:hypothetical protein